MDTLQKELLELLKKHGLKAGDAESTESSTEADQSDKKIEKTDTGSSEVVADLAASIAKKLTDAIAKNKGLTGGDAGDLVGRGGLPGRGRRDPGLRGPHRARQPRPLGP